MRKRTMLATTLAMTTATFGLWSAGSTWAHASEGALSFSVEHFEGEEVDVGEKGHSPGDQFVFTAELHGANDHQALDHPAPDEPAGKAGGQCVLLSESLAQCVATMVLAGGQITTQGLTEMSGHHAKGMAAKGMAAKGMAAKGMAAKGMAAADHGQEPAHEETYAITGGTGEYEGAGGEMHLTHEGESTTVVLHLT